jgi:hypothetical protein
MFLCFYPDIPFSGSQLHPNALRERKKGCPEAFIPEYVVISPKLLLIHVPRPSISHAVVHSHVTAGLRVL